MPSTPLDFDGLLSRDYKPAKLAQIQQQPKDDGASKRLEEHFAKKRHAAAVMAMGGGSGGGGHHHHHHHHHGRQQQDTTNQRLMEEYIRSEIGVVGDNGDVVVGTGGTERISPTTVIVGSMSTSGGGGGGTTETRMDMHKMKEETDRLVKQLVSKTPVYRMHLPKNEDGDDDDETRKSKSANSKKGSGKNDNDDNVGGQERIKSLSDYVAIPPPEPSAQEFRKKFPPQFHSVELDDWESKIDWDGDGGGGDQSSSSSSNRNNDNNDHEENSNETSSGSFSKAANSTDGPSAVSSSSLSSPASNPMELLEKRRNPFLENFSFENMVSWSGDPTETAAMAAATPLILELGVAGRSVAKLSLPSQRPEPFADSEIYRQRLHIEEQAKNSGGGGGIKTAAEAVRQGTFAVKDDRKKFIEQQQRRRRELEKSKAKRVRDAMASLGVMGAGRGRAVTSSLMGPGGTERTGRAARLAIGQTGPQEYIEQLDMVANHSLIKDPMGIITKREFHRPKLPQAIVRTTLVWQFCVRHFPGKGKKGGPGSGRGGGADNAMSYQALMMGNQQGAISKAKLRLESDLTPTEGDLVLLEYSEERPPIQLGTGMASKIITYYKGDKSKCPISRGGGDRPVRRKRAGDDQNTARKTSDSNGDKAEKPPRLVGPNLETSITDWVGKVPKRSKDDRKNEMENFDVLPEGVTQVLHEKDRGPFFGDLDDGQAVTGLVTNMFVAPLFLQKAESTDFLMILGRSAGTSAAGSLDTLKVVLREMPTSIFTVGQTEPRTKVLSPGAQTDKNFVASWNSFQIAKYLSSSAAKGVDVSFEQLHLHFRHIDKGSLRTRLNRIANFDKSNNAWSLKQIGEDGFAGVDRIGRSAPINPENVASYQTMTSFVEKLNDLGMEGRIYYGQHAVPVALMAHRYLQIQAKEAKDLARKLKKYADSVKSKKLNNPFQLQLYENAAAEVEAFSKLESRKSLVSQFIVEELQLTPWNLTSSLIDSHGKRDMMKLGGLGDPSGVGEGYSFLREETKERAAASGPSAADMKKITGTDDDLRKLTMKQMGAILKNKFGLKESFVKTLKRWDRVHMIRDLSTKSAMDGQGDTLERFARGEKKKTKDQQADYKQRINVIWKLQIAALSETLDQDTGDGVDDAGDQLPPEPDKVNEEAKKESDSESSDDDFLDEFADNFNVANETNSSAAQGGGGGSTSRLKGQDQDARQLAAFKRQQEEERLVGVDSSATTPFAAVAPNPNRKVVRQRITTTYPDGRQVTKFKFIVKIDEVDKVLSNGLRSDFRSTKTPTEYVNEDKQLGHAMFEEEDSFIWSGSSKRNERGKRGGRGRAGRAASTGRGLSKKNKSQSGKTKTKSGTVGRKRKAKDEEEADAFAEIQKRQTASSRKERGSSTRQTKPHTVFATKLGDIWRAADNLDSGNHFQKPVDRRLYSSYYEQVSHPMDLSTIKKKIDTYQYPSTEKLLKDFDLIKNNSIKFYGKGTVLAEEAGNMYNLVKGLIDTNSAELSHLEEAAAQVMGKKTTKAKGKNKKKQQQKESKASDDDSDYNAEMDLGDLFDDD